MMTMTMTMAMTMAMTMTVTIWMISFSEHETQTWSVKNERPIKLMRPHGDHDDADRDAYDDHGNKVTDAIGGDLDDHDDASDDDE